MASTGTIPKDISLICIKDNLSVIENLPEEILLKICMYLGLKGLGRCLQVSKRFRRISKDQKLWQRITLFRKEVPIEFIGQALTFGLKHLIVKECKLKRNRDTDMAMILDLYPKKNELKSLDLTNVEYRNGYDFHEKIKYIIALLESCHSLERFHFGGYLNAQAWDHSLLSRGYYSNFNFSKCIAQNGQTLMVLNLLDYDVRHCFEKYPGSVQLIIDSCTELKELALCSLKSADFGFVCKRLTPTICKLRIQTHSDDRIDNDKYVEILTKRCRNLTVLSLGAKVTNTSITNIIKNLSMSLEKLELRNQEDIVGILELRSMSKLKIVLLNGWLSSSEKKIHQQYFNSNLPHLKVVLCNCQTRDVMGIAVQERKKQKSKVDLFRDLDPVYP